MPFSIVWEVGKSRVACVLQNLHNQPLTKETSRSTCVCVFAREVRVRANLKIIFFNSKYCALSTLVAFVCFLGLCGKAEKRRRCNNSKPKTYNFWQRKQRFPFVFPSKKRKSRTITFFYATINFENNIFQFKILRAQTLCGIICVL